MTGMTYNELIKHFETQQKAAKALELKQPTIAGWKKLGFIPYERQCHIQLVTGGILQAERQSKAA